MKLGIRLKLLVPTKPSPQETGANGIPQAFTQSVRPPEHSALLVRPHVRPSDSRVGRSLPTFQQEERRNDPGCHVGIKWDLIVTKRPEQV